MVIGTMGRFFERFFAVAAVAALMAWVIPGAVLAEERIRIVVYGDSLTSGYQLRPEQAFAGRLDRKLREVGFDNIEVINMSVFGETTTGGVERFSTLLSKRPDIVVVQLGANDVQRGITTNLIYSNLVTIVSKLQENRIYTVLVGVKAPESMGYSYSKQIEAVYNRIASFYKIPFYPAALEGVEGDPKLTLADGYHPNSKGVEVMVEGMYRLIDAGLRWKMEAQRYQKEYEKLWPDSIDVNRQRAINQELSLPAPSDIKSPPPPVQ
jgi:acyl-CoA thioesterase I